MSVIRPAGIVDDEIARHRRIGIVVIGARYRLPQIRGEIPFQILLREESAQRLAAGRPVSADAAGERRRQRFHGGPRFRGRVHAAHQAHGLLDRRAGKAQRLPDRTRRPHGLDKIRRPEVIWLALCSRPRWTHASIAHDSPPRRVKRASPSDASAGPFVQEGTRGRPSIFAAARTASIPNSKTAYYRTNARPAKRCHASAGKKRVKLSPSRYSVEICCSR